MGFRSLDCTEAERRILGEVAAGRLVRTEVEDGRGGYLGLAHRLEAGRLKLVDRDESMALLGLVAKGLVSVAVRGPVVATFEGRMLVSERGGTLVAGDGLTPSGDTVISGGLAALLAGADELLGQIREQTATRAVGMAGNDLLTALTSCRRELRNAQRALRELDELEVVLDD